ARIEKKPAWGPHAATFLQQKADEQLTALEELFQEFVTACAVEVPVDLTPESRAAFLKTIDDLEASRLARANSYK
ncbi:unnamed protein product, partial [Prorocentrum cordatum]